MATARTRRRTLVAVLASATVLILLISSGGVVGGVRTGGRLVVAPFSWALNAVAHPLANVFAGAANYSDVVHQNQQLRAELSLARQDAAQSLATRNELQQLTATLHLGYVGSLPGVVAQVTSNSPTNFSATVSINQGSDDGILVGMPVVGGGGLVGRIVDVTGESSTVLLVTDQTSIVGCTWGNGMIDALVYGGGVNDPLSVSAVQTSAPLTPGTVFTTNGLQGGLFPSGLPVASVKTITLTPGTSTYDLTLTPAADLQHLSYVDVLLWEPGS